MRNPGTRHGKHKHPLYIVWRNMVQRCTNPKHAHNYARYGGRGICVCDEWMCSRQKFIDYCVSLGWQPGLELDRIDNDGHYEPGNIRFVTRQSNTRNRSSNVTVNVHGESMTLTEAVERFGHPSMTYGGILYRVRLGGWNVEQALSTPSRQRREEPCDA